jgi:hypothetical protein
MTTTDTTMETESATRAAASFNRCFETLDAGKGIIADDAFCDLYPPFWRLQLQGSGAFGRQLRAIASGPQTAQVLRVVPTASGFVMEHEESRRDPDPEVARRLWLCTVRDGLIVEAVGYCNGGWGDALRARHAVEAPMLRPWETDR